MSLFYKHLKQVWVYLALIIVLTTLATGFTTARPLAAAGVINITLDYIGYGPEESQEIETSPEDNLFDLNQVGTLITDFFIDKEEDESIEDSLPYFILALLVLSVLGGVFKYLGSVVNAYARKLVMKEIRIDIVDKLLSMSMEFFNRNKQGELISRIITDAKAFGVGIVSVTHHIFSNSLMISIYFVFLFNTDPRLTLAIILILLLHYLITAVLKEPIKKYETRTFEAAANLTSSLSEMFLNIRLIQSFSKKNFELEKSAKAIDSANEAEYKASVVIAAEPQARYILDGVVEGTILFVAVLHLFSESITIEGFLLYIYVARLMLGPLNQISTYFLWIQRIVVAHGRVNEYVSLFPKVVSGNKSIDKIYSSIHFKDVSFKYEDITVLNNINLELESNRVIAIVGESGSGKSTLLDLILRFYDPTEGNIYIDGTDIKELDIDSYRNIFGIVPQDVSLLNDTIKNNITYGRNINEEELNEAAEISNSLSFINKLPEGYDTIIGDRGVKLSGGQKQRLSIARAIIGNPDILMFDEATSSLDANAELEVQKAIETVLQNRSAIIVAHRMSTIKNVDHIIVMNDKKIEALGNHEDLIKSSETYRKLYLMH
jgi:ATP-binding cassette, subfamily B, bacterial MsbA